MTKLTDRQKELFNNLGSTLRKEVALAFIKQGYSNGTQAYLKACKKMKKKPAKNTATAASEILNYPKVKAFIESVLIEVADNVQINAQWVLDQAVEMINISKDAGNLKVAKGYLEMAGKHVIIGAFSEKIDINLRAVVKITRKRFNGSIGEKSE